jgi:homoserine/homoserine lactone efflux protein
MDMHLWLPYLFASLLTAFSPGQAVLLAVSNTLQHGGKRAMLGSAGNAAGICIVAGVALAGVASLLHAYPAALFALKVAGGGYLIYLGLRQWFAPGSSAPQAGRRKGLFAQGMVVALTNPKGLLFFAALFPQFMRVDRALWQQFLILTGTFVACAIAAHASFVLIAHHARGWLMEAHRLAALRKGSGLAFVLIGLAMLCA